MFSLPAAFFHFHHFQEQGLVGVLFLLGAGAGFRSALPVSSRTTVISGVSRKEYILDLGVPVFLRIGLEVSKWFVHVDGGYAIGLDVLFQQSTRQEMVIHQSGDLISTSVSTVKDFPAAINLRYGVRF